MISENDRETGSHMAEVDASERGASMVGLVLVLVILGALVAITLSSNLGTTPSTVGDTTPGASTTNAASSPSSRANEATASGCQANYATVAQAIETYRILNGLDPPAGTTWGSANANGGPFLQSWPSDAKSYAITWNGSILSVIPVHGRASHGSYGTSSPASGCFAT
jgi:hypothetical protein